MKTYLQFLEATSVYFGVGKPVTKVPKTIESGVTKALENPGESASTGPAEREREIKFRASVGGSVGGSQRQSQPQAKNRPAPSSTSTPDRGRTTPPTAGRGR